MLVRLASRITNYQFDEVGNLKQSALPNGVQNDYSYNTANLLTQLNVTKGASHLARYVYSYTPSRLRASMTELSGRTESYEYDDANQLVSQTISGAAANQNGTVRYVLDAVGNRVQRNSTIAALASTVNTFNNKDQLDTDGYDANGNTLAADGKTFTYTYDNRLKTLNGGAITLGYDGNNNRVTKTVGAVTTNYLVDELSPSGYAQVVEEQVGGQVNKAYVWGHMLISQRQLLAGNWVTHYYGQDGSENVRQLFDNTGLITDTFDYDAFGILIGRTGTTANSYLYRSQQFDADLGFYYNRARYYDQTRGRFLSRDDFGGINQSPRTLHKYAYGHADPTNWQDPSGYLVNYAQNANAVETPVITQQGGAIAVKGGQAVLSRKLAKEILPVGIRCTLNILAGYYGLPVDAIKRGLKLKSASYDEACEAVGEFISEAENYYKNEEEEEADEEGEEGEGDDQLVYVTYIKYNDQTGETYAGRARGYGSAREIVQARDVGHHRTGDGFGNAEPDKDAIATRPFAARHSDQSYQAIRGREQQLIDSYGGAWSDVGGQFMKGTRSGNKIRGIARSNPNYSTYHYASNAKWGELPNAQFNKGY